MADGTRCVILVTGPPSLARTEIARVLATQLRCPYLLEGVILGRYLSPRYKSRAVKVLREQTSARIDDDLAAEHTANAALRLVFSDVPLSFLKSTYDKGFCFVLEFPVADPEVLLNLLLQTSYEIIPSADMDFNRAIIIKCIPPADESSATSEWVELEEYLVEEVRLWGDIDRHYNYSNGGVSAGITATKAYTNIYQVINRKLSSMSSDIRLDSSKLSSFSKLEIDLAHDIYQMSFLKYESNTQYIIDRALSIPLFQAVQYLIFEHDVKEEGPVHLTMRKWGQFRLDYFRRSGKNMGESAMCYKGTDYHHFVKVNINECRPLKPACGDGDDDHRCTFCGKEIATVAADSEDYYYSCGYCSLHMHKACAEWENMSKNSFEPLSDDEDVLFDIIKDDICKSCKQHEQVCTRKCKACIFYSFVVKCLRPAIIDHQFLPELIQIRLPALNEMFTELLVCAACGKLILQSYNRYFHTPESLYFGFSCVAHLPLEIKEHTHFGHCHPLKLMDKPHQKLDYYICHICLEERHQDHWYYYCEECEYTVHPYCIHKYVDAYH